MAQMREGLVHANNRFWMGLYLRVLAVGYAVSALIHCGNLLGFGERQWPAMPLAWKLGDIGYTILDTVVAIGLWRKALWGIGGFFLAALSQLILYLGFPDLFAFTDEHRQALHGLVTTHVVTLGVFFALLVAKK